MTALSSCRDGIQRVNRAPLILVGVWALTVLFGIPLSLGVRDAIARQLGSSLEADRAASGASYDWLSEFGDQATGAATTFGPSVIGFAATLDNASALVDGGRRPAVIVATGAGYALLWTFLAGGMIDRYGRGRASDAAGFFHACGSYFPRLLRLGLLAAVVYGVLFGAFHGWLLDKTYDTVTRNVSAERTAFLIRLTCYALFLTVLSAINLWFDYAKVRLVIENRRSAAGALRTAARLIARQPTASIELYLCDAALFALVVAAYALVAPGAGSTGLSMWMGAAVGQLYIAARLWVKLVFWASECAWFRGHTA